MVRMIKFGSFYLTKNHRLGSLVLMHPAIPPRLPISSSNSPRIRPAARSGATRLGLAAMIAFVAATTTGSADVNTVQTVAPQVYFHEGEITGKGHCNNGWIIFEDYVVVIDANFPSGAKVVLPKIRALTDKPIRFAFDTHHHGDHAYGNQLWHDAGAIPVAHAGVVEEMKKYEDKTFGGPLPGRWEEAAKNREDIAKSRLKIPSLLFKNELFFDDGKIRVELLHFGVAHTHGDGFAWLPKEKILFTGDACVNGPFNYTGDGDIGAWIETLRAVQALGPKVICPGHGPMGGPEVLEDQIQFFIKVRAEAKALLDAGKTPAEAKDNVEHVIDRLRSNTRIQRFVGKYLSAQLEKAWKEMGGAAFPTD
jgi:glyoxylase-like metal-dependent hydrolase (beta-lactamase superfamily II)